MKRNSTKIKARLYELGKTVGLEEHEIDRAKRMAKTMASMFVIAIIFTLIGFFSSRLGAVGNWYGGVSIKDFHMFSRFFRFF